ncbi:metalloregulator ArsR/SmtB family transcription factor [Conexibacter sp. W3-3-2]|uniref:ArsR/SmtB family transcription factor n=1 Tax=Conexibacter sp. W3-3-2 TaxID=2675227 RepID=UPI0012B6DB8A|nr:metalloregulator ArsR/SmtB family transcription factor [Conexibacter sp. W3-3-2]MTD43656.1 metalloregulator ArsR/SmtB family transcription factor [Conexibacter sp. W3-3-2]
MSESCDLLCLDLDLAERLRQELPALEELETMAEQVRALADPTRLGLAMALRDGGELCVCDLAWVSGRQERLVSHHVRQLRAGGLATSRKEGRMVLYSLTSRGSELLAVVASTSVRA